jgi:hypothetical protein
LAFHVRSDQRTDRLQLHEAVSQRLQALSESSVYRTVLQARLPAPGAPFQLLHLLALSVRVVCWRAEMAAAGADGRMRGIYTRARTDRLFGEDGARRICLICGAVFPHPGRYLAHLEERHGDSVTPLDDSVF